MEILSAVIQLLGGLAMFHKITPYSLYMYIRTQHLTYCMLLLNFNDQ